jgi:3-phenylpropionate/trans-cinnamate dioxygenase ferredoxin subunit
MPSRRSLIDVGAVEDFLEGRPKVVEVGGRELGIIHWRGAFYAVRNVCAHMGARLCLGTVTARMISDGPMSPIEADYAHPVITCPWHGWTFDIGSGNSVFDPRRFRVKSYPVLIQSGRVLVELGRG